MSDSEQRIYRGRGIRLNRSLYAVPFQVTAFTLGTYKRRPIFTDRPLAESCIDDLRIASERANVDVLAYCFMPDHAHILLQPTDEVDLVAFLQRYKSWTTRRAWNRGVHGKLWQRSFYDHILRDEDDLLRHMRYVVENPVRAGLVEDWADFPLTGSFVFEFSEWDW